MQIRISISFQLIFSVEPFSNWCYSSDKNTKIHSGSPFITRPNLNHSSIRWTSTTTTQRSSCATKTRSTCLLTSTRSVSLPPCASAPCSCPAAAQTCTVAWSMHSTCCLRGAAKARNDSHFVPFKGFDQAVNWIWWTLAFKMTNPIVTCGFG